MSLAGGAACASARTPAHPDMPTKQAPPELLLQLLRGLHGLCAPRLHSLLAHLRAQHAKCGTMVSAYSAWSQRDAGSTNRLIRAK